jgi:DegV family protein with EDD domain
LTVIDTKCVSLGLGLIVKQAGEMALRGASKQEIIEMVNLQSKRMEHLFTVDDLEYLFRGGRISKASAFVGSLLKIKPLLNVEDGKLIPIEKIRGRKKVLKRMIELMKERGQNLNEQTVAISHADDEETALILKEMIQETFGCKDVYISSIGAVIGAHVGPGTLSVFFLND